MKKLARNISILLIALLMACCLIVGFTACGDDDSSSSGGTSGDTSGGTSGGTSGETYIFEAEYANLLDQERFGSRSYQGYSNNGFTPVLKSTDASNGYCVGNMYVFGTYIYFEIESSAETEADIYLSLSMEAECMSGSESTITLDYDDYRVYLNPTTLGQRTGDYIEYENELVFDVAGMSDIGYHKAFKEYFIATVTLSEGTNYIVLQTGQTRRGQGGTMDNIAPIVDYLRIDTEATLSMSIDTAQTSGVTATSTLFT